MTIIHQTSPRQRGFSLIEVLVSLGILMGLISLGARYLTPPGTSIKQAVRELGLLGREIRTQARLKNVTYRLVIKLGEEDSSYFVEAANTPVLVQSEQALRDEEFKTKDEKTPSPFSKVEKFFGKKEKKLPRGLFFKSVETIAREQPVTEGTAYIHFSPDGLVESSAVQITDKKNLNWTVVFNSLTGHAEIIQEAVKLSDLKVE